MPELFTGDTVTAAMSATSAPPASSASPADTPSDAAADVSSAEATAATLPAESDGTVTTESDPTKTAPPAKGEPPKEKWPQILDNARAKVADEIKKQYAWADAIHESHRATVSEFYQALDTEPVQAIEALIATAANDPVHAPALRSLLGRLLGGRSAETPAMTPKTASAATVPEPDFQDEKGHQFYSATRMREALDALEARIDAKYAKELDPLKTDFLTRDAKTRLATQQAKAKQAAAEWSEARYAKVSQWPEFATYEKEIAAAMTADPDLDIGDAYVDLVVPKLSQTERKKVVTSMQDKARASSIHPSTPASAASAPPTDFREAARQMWGA